MMENYLLHYDYEAICVSSEEYILSYNNKYYKVGEPIYNILSAGKSAKSFDELYSVSAIENTFSKSDLSEIITTKILPIFKSNEDTKTENKKSFWIKKQLLNSDMVTQLATPFSFMFGKMFYLFLLVFIAINAILFYQVKETTIVAETFPSFGIWKWILSYFSLFVIVFMHEIGHAAAAIKSGIKPRSIGLGFYTVLPVMYTDLTDAWKLNKSNKTKVNLGGMFIQLIIGVLLIGFANLTQNIYTQELMSHLFMVNNTIILLNLIPFLKFDGYWILSDLLGISNLIQESNKKVVNLFTKKGPFDDEQQGFELKIYQNIFVIIYSILRVLFITGMVLMVFGFVIHSMVRTFYFIKYLPYMEYNTQFTLELLKRVLVFLIIYVFTKKYTKWATGLIFKKRDK